MDEYSAEKIADLLKYPEDSIQLALYDADIDAEYDGVNWNVFDVRELPAKQGLVTIGMSLDQDDQLNYQARRETYPDRNGFVRSWEYHWNEKHGHVFYAFAPRNELFFESSFDTNRVKRAAYPLGIYAVSDLVSLIGHYESSKSKQTGT